MICFIPPLCCLLIFCSVRLELDFCKCNADQIDRLVEFRNSLPNHVTRVILVIQAKIQESTQGTFTAQKTS